MIKIDFVNGEDVFDEVKKHIEAHKSEMEKFSDGDAINIDYPTYLGACRAGQVFALTLRHFDRLVGYSVFFVGPDLRDVKNIQATNHGIFVEEQYRQNYGLRMLKDAEKFLVRLGITEIQYLNKDPVFCRFLRMKGFTDKHIIWSKKYVRC